MQIQIENEETVWSVDPLQRAATAFFFSIADVRKTSKTEKQIVNFPCFPNVFGSVKLTLWQMSQQLQCII